MSPIILGLETSTDACSVAIYTPTQIFEVFVVQPQAHSKLLLDMVDNVLSQAGISLKEIDAFAFGRGPGSFTGVRIAASAIQGLAFGVAKPVIGISSLQALAQQAFNKFQVANIVALLDAKMHEVYYGVYKIGAHDLVEAEMEDSLQKPEQLQLDEAVEYLAVGTGVKSYQAIISANNPALNLDLSIEYPRAYVIVQLAAQQFALGNISLASSAIPTYIRNDVAKKSDKKNPDQGGRDKN